MDNKRVFFVDDNDDARFLLKAVVDGRGHEIDCVESLAQALEVWRSGRYDIVLTDMSLPDGSGLDLCRHIRQEGSTVPVFVYSGYSSQDVKDAARDAGADSFYVKPIDFTRMVADLEGILAGAAVSG